MKRLLLACVLIAGALGVPAAFADDGACNNAAFLAVQYAHVNHAEVTFCGTVVRVRAPRHTRSGWHRAIYVDAGHRDRIEIDANLDEMGNFPVAVGDRAVVTGEYYYDANGREGVHWTHHTDRGSHPPGSLTLNGTTYR
jgi:hypothetical protein